MLHAACNVARLYEISYVKGVECPFDIHCVTAVFLMLLMSRESKVHLIYNVASNTKSLNYMKIRLKPLIYFELEQTLN